MLTFPKFRYYGFKWWWGFFEEILRRRKFKKKFRNWKEKIIRRWRKEIIRGLIRGIIRRRWNLRKTYKRRNKLLKKKTLNGIVKRLNF